jgi:CRISPR-associated protein Cas6
MEVSERIMNMWEIQFALRGKTLPADHGYALYSAIKKTVLEEQDLPPEVLLCSVPGIPDKDGMIYLNHSSRLRLRCPAEQSRHWYRLLQNQVLDIRGHLIRLVQPRLTLPQPSEILKARLVTFKLETIAHHDVPRYFLESCQKALEQLDIKAQIFIDSNANGDLARRAIKVKNKHIVGYGVVVEGLNEDDSIKLQCQGLGGRKHFGCGWFYPVKELGNAD